MIVGFCEHWNDPLVSVQGESFLEIIVQFVVLNEMSLPRD